MKPLIDTDCHPKDIAIKSLFLGPQSENGAWFCQAVMRVLENTINWRKSLFPADGSAISQADQTDPEFLNLRGHLESSLEELLRRLEDEQPKFTPRYIGHMVSETTLPALLAEFAMLLHNPNNASPEVAKVSAQIETEAIAALSEMLGYLPNRARGHFTSGGTLANFEAVWRAMHRFDKNLALALYLIDHNHYGATDLFSLIHLNKARYDALFAQHSIQAGNLEPYSILSCGRWSVKIPSQIQKLNLSPILLVPSNKHYSWPKAALMFGLGLESFWQVRLDAQGRLDIDDLRLKIEHARSECRPILMIVSVAGTTEMGEVDPIEKVQDLIDLQTDSSFWHHVDAAYGGFFASVLRGEKETSPTGFEAATEKSLGALGRVSSITIDPHKLGYIPYACGAFIARDQEHYESRRIAAPYLKADSPQANWATTLEGSRSAAGAAAVWLTSRTLGFTRSGFGRILTKTIEAKELFRRQLLQVDGICLVDPCDTNIICFTVAEKNQTLTNVNRRAKALFELIESGPEFSVTRTILQRHDYKDFIARFCLQNSVVDDGSDFFLLRLVLMNPFICSQNMDTDFALNFATEIANALKTKLPRGFPT